MASGHAPTVSFLLTTYHWSTVCHPWTLANERELTYHMSTACHPWTLANGGDFTAPSDAGGVCHPWTLANDRAAHDRASLGKRQDSIARAEKPYYVRSLAHRWPPERGPCWQGANRGTAERRRSQRSSDTLGMAAGCAWPSATVALVGSKKLPVCACSLLPIRQGWSGGES